MAGSEFRLKYAGSALGYVWSVVKPLALFTMLYVVFARLFKLGTLSQYYPVSLLMGIVLFNFFADATSLGMTSLVARESLLRKLVFPRMVIPTAATVTAALTFAVNSVVVAGFIAWNRITPQLDWLLVIPLLVELYVFILGIALLLSVLFVRFRDISQIWELALQLMFYASPIIYPIGFLPPELRKLAFINPFTQVLQDIRALILYPDLPGQKITADGRIRSVRTLAADRHSVRNVRSRLRRLPARGTMARRARVSALPAIAVQGVSKTFHLPHENRTTLKEHFLHPRRGADTRCRRLSTTISFTVDKGEFFGIIGPNGSGKSTLLKVIAGIYRQNAGTVHLEGRLSPFIELGVGFSPELTARDNIRINGTLLGLTRTQIAERFDEIVAFSGLERFIDQKLKNFSSGMHVRLAYSIAIQVDFDDPAARRGARGRRPASFRSGASRRSQRSERLARRSCSCHTISERSAITATEQCCSSTDAFGRSVSQRRCLSDTCAPNT